MGLEGGFILETVTSAATGPQPESRPAHPAGEEGASSPWEKDWPGRISWRTGPCSLTGPILDSRWGLTGPGEAPSQHSVSSTHTPRVHLSTRPARTHPHSPPGPFCRNGGREGGRGEGRRWGENPDGEGRKGKIGIGAFETGGWLLARPLGWTQQVLRCPQSLHLRHCKSDAPGAPCPGDPHPPGTETSAADKDSEDRGLDTWIRGKPAHSGRAGVAGTRAQDSRTPAWPAPHTLR